MPLKWYHCHSEGFSDWHVRLQHILSGRSATIYTNNYRQWNPIGIAAENVRSSPLAVAFGPSCSKSSFIDNPAMCFVRIHAVLPCVLALLSSLFGCWETEQVWGYKGGCIGAWGALVVLELRGCWAGTLEGNQLVLSQATLAVCYHEIHFMRVIALRVDLSGTISLIWNLSGWNVLWELCFVNFFHEACDNPNDQCIECWMMLSLSDGMN